MIKDLRSKMTPLTSLYENTFWCSDDDAILSDHATQTEGELSPLIIKPKRYTKKRSPPKKVKMNLREFPFPLVLLLSFGNHQLFLTLQINTFVEMITDKSITKSLQRLQDRFTHSTRAFHSFFIYTPLRF